MILINEFLPYGLTPISSYPRSLWYRVLEWLIPSYENIYCMKSQSLPFLSLRFLIRTSN